MKKITIILLLAIITYPPPAKASSGHFSAEISPSLSINKIYCSIQPPLSDKGLTLRVHFGAAYHFPLHEHYTLSAGLSYACGHISLFRPKNESLSLALIDEEHFLQYIWIPILLRLYTSELMIDTRFYLKLGFIPAIQFPSRTIFQSNPEGKNFAQIRSLGCFIPIGIGMKYDFSPTNGLELGFSYCLDLVGIMYKKESLNGQIYGHNNFVRLDICFLF